MSKSPQTLAKEFLTLFGPGRYARIVWQVEGRDGRKANFDLGEPSRLMALDTRDGIVRELVPARPGTHFSSATFTWDGKRVVYTDGESKRVQVIDWDGSGDRVLLNGYDGDGHCWQSPDGKHWVLASEWNDDPKTFVKFQRVNIDDPSERVEILTTSWARPEWAGATCWASLSPDGTHVAAGFPNYDNLGLLETATGKIRRFPVNGCWPAIARDNSHDVLYTNGGDDAHCAIRIIDQDLNPVLMKNLRDGVLGADEFHESLRWTPDRDYLTISLYRPGFVAKGIPSPRIVRISDQRYVAINDDPETPEGNADVFFYQGDQGSS